MTPRTRPAPNVADPLSESTPGRRVHAAYLLAGFSRAEFQRELGVSYVTVDNWDKGGAIKLENLLHAAATLGYTMDQLCYGHHPPPRKHLEPELSRDEIKLLLVELGATLEQTDALGAHELSAAGRFQRFTRTYVATYIAVYASALSDGRDPAAASDLAKQQAAQARAQVEAAARGLTKTAPSDETLRAAGKRSRVKR